MASVSYLYCLLVSLAVLIRAAPEPSYKRQSSSLTVDLGYEVYEGFANTTTNINNWLGIRYAQPPTGSLRWQPPKAPLTNRNATIQASAYPPRCNQGPDAPGLPGVNFTGTEDCLFLSVQAPSNASNLPVLVWIHGGGYGEGQGNQDLSALISANNNSFVGVVIQYRLAAFGFLSSAEVSNFGTPNAGILDQHFSLEWVQNYIHLFGGDPRRVTISGESAGGGSVMLQVMAYGGTQGTSLFQQAIASSPYLPMQYGYADFQPSQAYYAFAYHAGCFDGIAYGNTTGTIFECLVGKDEATLQNASSFVSGSGLYGTWAFVPVTDGKLIQQLPSQQLQKSQVNGQSLLIGNNANEGPLFVRQNITTEDDFVAFIRQTFPLFSEDDISEVLAAYPSTNASVDPSIPDFATNGITGATALNESTFGTGQQQRADNLYAETTFVCPAYWMGLAFNGGDYASYKYQFSVIGAQHGADVAGYFGPAPVNYGPDFEYAFMKIWGNFITSGDPSISNQIANGVSSNSTATNPASSWPTFSYESPYQIDLNQTGGTPVSVPGAVQGMNITVFGEPGLANNITLVNAATWEGGRGARCEFWRSVGQVVPE